jgi:exopolysaccharide biosynthesis WecB/TagA/CpsF family protein
VKLPAARLFDQLKSNRLSELALPSIFTIPITLCSFDQGANLLEEMIRDKLAKLVVLANAHTLNLAYEREEYRAVLRNAALVLRDGVGVSWAVKKKGALPLHNFVGTDFIPDFCKHTTHKGYRIYLLGSQPGVAQRAANKLASMAPGLIIADHHHGYFNPDRTDKIIRAINASRADILLVAMGNPKQEMWIANNLDQLEVPVAIGVGALFDYLSGHSVRAPRWILNLKMEWVFRLMMEPMRLWRRYLIGNLKFIFRVYRECFTRKDSSEILPNKFSHK